MKKWTRVREKFLFWLVEDVFKVPENTVFPWYLTTIRRMLFPVWSFLSENKRLRMDFEYMAIWIEGVCVSLNSLKQLKNAKDGDVFVISKPDWDYVVKFKPQEQDNEW